MTTRVVITDSTHIEVITASQGLTGPQGPPGNGSSFEHDQLAPSAVWSITHNMHKYPAVTITDNTLTAVEGVVQYIDDDSLSITFNTPIAGKAVLN